MAENNLKQEIRWLLEEKYRGERTAAAESDIKKLEKGEHVDYVIGWVDFLGCRIDLSQKPFIPEPETEYWVEKAISQITEGSKRGVIRVLDIFAGSGCIGVAVLKHCPSAVVDFAEKERDFVNQIETNAEINSIDPERYRVIRSDIFSDITDHYDVIFANPPYLAESKKHLVQRSVLDHNGSYETIFGGQDGLLYIRRFLDEARKHLKRGGIVYLEFDSRQKNSIARLLAEFGYRDFAFFKDQYGKWRYMRVVL